MKRLIISLLFGLLMAYPAMAEEIDIVGTGDGVTVLKAMGEAFTQNNPDIVINVPESIGSGGGIKAVGTDKNLIGRVARDIKEKEKPYGLSYLPFAKVPTVFFVNKSISIQNLSAQQICDIYSGKITNWKEVGGKNAKIRVVRREEGDSSLNVLLKSFPGFRNITITSYSKTTFSTPETFSTIEKISDTIGFGSYDIAQKADVNVLRIDGKHPTDAEYPYVVNLGLIYKEQNKTGNIKKFLEFAVSSEAREVIRKAGGMVYEQ